MTHDRRLIEDYLPLEGISYQSSRDKSIRHGHISTLHIWWARRPLAAMRAAIFASLIPAPEDEDERTQLCRLIAGAVNPDTEKWEGGICDWDNVKNGNTYAIEQAQEHIKKHYPDERPSVLDPFMGGGSTGLEALRLGCDAYGVELNPVAHIIELCTLVYPQKYGQLIPREEYETRPGTLPPVEVIKYFEDEEETNDWDPTQTDFLNQIETDELVNPLEEDVRRWGYWVQNKAKAEIGSLYEDEKDCRTIVAYLWARTVTCPNPNCRAEMPLLRQYWLSRKSGNQVTLIPRMDERTGSIFFEVQDYETVELENFDPSNGTMKTGSATCLVCSSSAEGNYLRAEAKNNRMGERLIAVVYLNPSDSGKSYGPATEEHVANFDAAVKQLNQILKSSPEYQMNEMISSVRPSANARGVSGLTRYGLTEFGELFNDRQRLLLLTLSKYIKQAYEQVCSSTDKEYGRVIATYLAFGLDKVADYNSVQCTWHSSREGIAHTFGRQALPMVWDYAEINPFSGSTGDWFNAIDWVCRVIKHCSLASSREGHLFQGTATSLSEFDTNSIDAIVTDPPYYDSVPYSDLADFFYVIMKRSIGHLYPDLFQTPLTPKSLEIIEHARHGDNARHFYETKMTEAFTEARRVLKDDGIFTVVFAHTSTSAWETLINSLLRSDLIVTASWPVHTELKTRVRAQGNASLASSIFIVCRKREANQDGIFDDVRNRLQERIRERLSFFWREGIRGADFFISAIGPAVEVFGQYRIVRKLSGEEVTVAELLDIVQQEVANYALSQVLNGSAERSPLDPATRYYIMYRWSYDRNKVEFDDGMRLAQALGAEIDEMLAAGILNKSGSSVELQGPYLRKKKDKLGEPGRDHQLAPLVDLLHRAAMLWQDRQREELAEFMRDHVAERTEAMRTLAQAIINIMPDGDKERQLYEGFLQTDLPTAPRQGKLW